MSDIFLGGLSVQQNRVKGEKDVGDDGKDVGLLEKDIGLVGEGVRVRKKISASSKMFLGTKHLMQAENREKLHCLCTVKQRTYDRGIRFLPSRGTLQ